MILYIVITSNYSNKDIEKMETKEKCKVNFEFKDALSTHEQHGAGVKITKSEPSERTTLIEIDTETSVTIGSIYRYIEKEFTKSFVGSRYRLYYENQALNNHELTLADYGWINGTVGTIDVIEVW